MAVFRVEKTRDYTVMANHHLRNTELSLKAKGLLLFLPLYLNDEIPEEHKDGIDMARDMLRRSRVLVVCGDVIDENVKNDIATAERFSITATTFEGILTIKKQGRGKSNG